MRHYYQRHLPRTSFFISLSETIIFMLFTLTTVIARIQYQPNSYYNKEKLKEMTTAIDALNHYLNFPGGDILTEVVNILEPQWQLTDVYQGNTFFDGFDFFNDTDPTHGFVNYVNKEKAQHDGLIKIDKSSIVMKVDNSTTFATASKNQERGRSSVRISSHKDYDSGLFLFDVEHIPVACGAWPALWLLGPNWPNGGEIDVIHLNILKR